MPGDCGSLCPIKVGLVADFHTSLIAVEPGVDWRKLLSDGKMQVDGDVLKVKAPLAFQTKVEDDNGIPLLDPKCFKGVCQKYTLQPVILRVFADQTTPSCAANTKEMAFNNEATITFFLILGMTFRGLVHESEQQCFEITASQEFPCGKVDTDVMDYLKRNTAKGGGEAGSHLAQDSAAIPAFTDARTACVAAYFMYSSRVQHEQVALLQVKMPLPLDEISS